MVSPFGTHVNTNRLLAKSRCHVLVFTSLTAVFVMINTSGCMPPPPAPNSNSANDGQKGNKSNPVTLVAASPQEIIDKLNAASESRDWDTWVSCLSPQGELQICGTIMNMRPISLVVNGPVPEHLNLSQEEARKLKKWATKLNAVLNKYGLSSATDVRQAKRNLVVMKNRSELVREFIDCVFDPDAPEKIVGDRWPFTAQIRIVGDIQVDGNEASAQFNRTGDASKSTQPIDLKIINGQWRISRIGLGGVANY